MRPHRPLPLVVAAGVLFVATGAVPAGAHDRGVSYSDWELEGPSARVTLRVTEWDLSRVPPGVEPARRLSRELRLLAGGRPCPVDAEPEAWRPEEGRRAFSWTVRCPDDGPLVLRHDVFAETAPGHLHIARVRRPSGPVEEHVLSDRAREAALAGPGESRGSGLGGYVALGITHILTGYDHVAFVTALVLMARSLLGVATVVTGFTLAHSLTLALATLGWVRVETAPVEALIGLSIALVAAENLWLRGGRPAGVPATIVLGLAGAAAVAPGTVPALTLAGFALFVACYFPLLSRSRSPERLRGVVAFVFGLLHGFGFASILIEAELPSSSLAAGLFGFNAGVEIGQLGVVALLWAALRGAGAARRGSLVDGGSATVLALGTFWFVSRCWG